MPNSDDQQILSEEELIQKFQEARRQVANLQVEFKAGKITREELQARMLKHMVLDDKNTWWSIGVETGAWYKLDHWGWIIAPLPVSIPAEEELAKSIAEKRESLLFLEIDDRPIPIKFAPLEPQDPNKIPPPSLNSQLSDEDIEREAKEALRKFLEKERQQKSQKDAPDQE